ncbi:MAG: hypothetical protein NTZ93_03945 [Candidatus Beckwithbacteria bacterium]|nr:hypothetical protein [Candidatus Beckwithbacteria bacterium]
MTELVEAIFQDIKDIPVEQRPEIRSLLVSLIGTHHEANHNLKAAIQAWIVNDGFLQEIISKNPEEAFNFGVSLATLPKSENPSTELYKGYLRGNGLNILFDERLHDRLTQHLNSVEAGGKLSEKIEEFLGLDVKGWDADKAYSTPEGFNLLCALNVGTSLEDSPEESMGRRLFETATKQLENSDVRQLIGYFKKSPDTSAIAAKLDPYLQASA